jgi:hypothetical protein
VEATRHFRFRDQQSSSDMPHLGVGSTTVVRRSSIRCPQTVASSRVFKGPVHMSAVAERTVLLTDTSLLRTASRVLYLDDLLTRGGKMLLTTIRNRFKAYIYISTACLACSMCLLYEHAENEYDFLFILTIGVSGLQASPTTTSSSSFGL